MIVKLFLANVFADGLFSGGKAAVAVLRHLGQEVFLQALAAELALPVTAYVLPNQDRFVIRYFTPEREVERADYAALAAARVLLNIGLTPAEKPVKLQGRVGVLSVLPEGERLALALPRARAGAEPPEPVAEKPPAALAGADILGVRHLGSAILICCRDQGALRRIAAREAMNGAGGRRLIFSAPLELPGVSGYGFREFTAEGEDSGPPFDLAPHAALPGFCAQLLPKAPPAEGPLELHRLSARNLLMRVEQRGDGLAHVFGRVNLIFKADPLMDELTGNLPPDLFF